MSECVINGISVKFPFEPYELQQNYMSKVIECLQKSTHGVLESPTGTGKTLSLLCSSLAWLETKKAQMQAEMQKHSINDLVGSNMLDQLNAVGGKTNNERSAFVRVPQIIYSSRTHSQLAQAMQEMKRTSYSYMKANVIGSRDQLCINSEVTKEENRMIRENLCLQKTKAHTCMFYNRVDKMKDSPLLMEQSVMDIEDIVKLGEKHKFCPYYIAKDMKKRADVIFMPYNYLLDPLARKALGVELSDNIVILDEAHNIEKMCEDSASIQIKTTDIALCINEITDMMKLLEKETIDSFDNSMPNINPDDLCNFKQMFLDFEKVLDSIKIPNSQEGVTFDGGHIYQLLSDAGIRDDNNIRINNILQEIITFLATVSGSGPFQNSGNGLKQFTNLLTLAFSNTNKEAFKEKVKKCYKVHIDVEAPKKKQGTNWLSKATAGAACRVLSYWCFSPGFGMGMLMNQGIRSVILTSGTLAPLAPLITELEIDVQVRLENPHIVKGDQICVKILSKGPDGHILNSSYQTRENPAYIKSLGMTINNLARIIPNGLLIFFPSYPLMRKCRDAWQEAGLWSSIVQHKSIFVEPQDKTAFNEAMTNYYKAVNDPLLKGAIFMGVCRGKVSEGLDFADGNGRAVIITGIPYPPFKDPKVVLKKQYLDRCRVVNKEYLRGDDWYSLEATKAVNQAVGRVIRHRYDYGAIILLDARFNNPRVTNQMSAWLRGHIKHVNNYAEIIRDLNSFFRYASQKFPVANKLKPLKPEILSQTVPAMFNSQTSKQGDNFDFSTSSSCSSLNSTNGETNSLGLVSIHKRRNVEDSENMMKRRKIKIIPNNANKEENINRTDIKEYLRLVKSSVTNDEYQKFLDVVKTYRDKEDFEKFCGELNSIISNKPNIKYIVMGLQAYIRVQHKEMFQTYCDNIQNAF